MKKFPILIFFLFACFYLGAKTKSPQCRVYLKLAYKAYNSRQDSVPIYLDLAYQSALKDNNDSSRYQALIEKVNYYGVISNKELGDSTFNFAEKIIKTDRHKARLYLAYGFFNKGLGNYKQALHQFLKAYNLGNKLNDYFVLCGSALNVSKIYGQQERFDLSLEYARKAFDYAQKGNMKDKYEMIYNQLGSIYHAKHNYSEAEKYYNMVNEIVTKDNDTWGIIICNNNKSILYIDQKKYDLAEEMYLKNLKLCSEIEDKQMFYQTLFELSFLNLTKGDVKKARSYLEKASSGLKYLNSDVDLRNIYYKSYKVYKANNDYEKALAYHEKFKLVSDTLLKKSSDKTIYEMDIQFRTKEKQQKINNLAALNKNKQEQLNKKNTFLIVSVCVIALILIILFQLWNFQKKLKAAKSNLEQKNELIEAHRKEILDSIHYAKRIQSALLAHDEYLKENLPEHFILFKPKDIVSGDFYWATKNNGLFYLAVCDSTGHGVPGAFMSLLNTGFLSEAINEKNIYEPGEIFNYTRKRLRQSLSKDGQRDGFDGIIICVDKAAGKITYAAANNSIILIRNGSLSELPYDKMPVGLSEGENSFISREIKVGKGDKIYLYTDGYADQFGGPKGKKFKYKQLNDLLLNTSKQTLSEQKAELDETFENWRGNLEQVDDVAIIGISI